MEDDVQSACKGEEEIKEQKNKEIEEGKEKKFETESNRFSHSCMPYSMSLMRAKSSDTVKSVDNRTRVDY